MQDSSFTSVLQSLVSVLQSERSFKNIKLDLVTSTLKFSKDFLVRWIKIQGLKDKPTWSGCLVILLLILLISTLCIVYGQDSVKNPTPGIILAAGSCSGAFSCIWHHYRTSRTIPWGQTFLLPISSLCFQDLFPLWCLSPANALYILIMCLKFALACKLCRGSLWKNSTPTQENHVESKKALGIVFWINKTHLLMEKALANSLQIMGNGNVGF